MWEYSGCDTCCPFIAKVDLSGLDGYKDVLFLFYSSMYIPPKYMLLVDEADGLPDIKQQRDWGKYIDLRSSSLEKNRWEELLRHILIPLTRRIMVHLKLYW